MPQEIDIRYIVDKLIDAGERSLDIQSETLAKLLDLKSKLDGNTRDHDEIRRSLDSLCSGIIDASVEHRSTDKMINEILIKVSSITDLHETMKKVMLVVGFVLGMLTLINFCISLYMYFSQINPLSPIPDLPF